MSSNGTMSGFGFKSSRWGDQDTGHHSEGSESLGQHVGLDISVVIFACPHISSITLDALSNHIIDQSVLIIDVFLLELFLVLAVIDVLEGVLKESVVSLQDGVLGGQEQVDFLQQGVLQARLGEIVD